MAEAPLFGRLGRPRPSALWDLATRGTFEPQPVSLRIPPGFDIAGRVGFPAVPAVAGGGAGAALKMRVFCGCFAVVICGAAEA